MSKRSRSSSKLRQLEDKIAELSRKLVAAETENAFFRKQLYGPKRDRPSDEAQLLIQELFQAQQALAPTDNDPGSNNNDEDDDEPDPNGGGGALTTDQTSGDSSDSSNSTSKPKCGKKGPAKAKRLPLINTGLEERVVTVAADPKLAINPETGESYPISHYVETRRLAEDPAKLYVLITRRPVYQKTNDLGESTLVTTPVPANNPIERCKADVSLLTGILQQKYQYHLPLYRIQEMYQAGTIGLLPRSTLCGWITGCAVALEPIVKRMKELMMEQKLIGLDDTTVCLIVPGNGKVDPAKLWAYTCLLEAAPYVVYDFTRTREARHPLAFVPESFQGTIQGDAYSGHDRLMSRPGVSGAGCWDHARRYITDASELDPKRTAPVLLLIKNLYAIERQAAEKGLDAEERKALRQKEAVPILDEIKAWVKKTKADPFLLGKTQEAVVYLTNQWERLTHYLSDGDIPISNIHTERAMRGVGVGRKNWLFCGSEAGGENLAIILSLVTTCKNLGIDVRCYLEDVLSRVNAHPHQRLDELLPDRWKSIQEAAGRDVSAPKRQEWRKPSAFAA